MIQPLLSGISQTHSAKSCYVTAQTHTKHTTTYSRSTGYEICNSLIYCAGQWRGLGLATPLITANSVSFFLTRSAFIQSQNVFPGTSNRRRNFFNRLTALIYIYVYVCVCVYIYIYIYIHTHTHTHIYSTIKYNIYVTWHGTIIDSNNKCFLSTKSAY